MPAKSKAQQRLFQMALAVRKGDLPRSKAWKSVLKIADGDMTDEQIKDFCVLENKNHILRTHEFLIEGLSFDKQQELLDKMYDLKMKWKGYMEEISQLNQQRQQLEIDQEDEVGRLYVDGNEFEAEKLAQEYGREFDKIDNEIESLTKKADETKKKISKLDNQYTSLIDKDYKKTLKQFNRSF